ncbi:hypothetical protein [Streptomyces sp. NBC_00259]|uniref:hypothetical protein n=1 Tax=Streptomyces sp. NBC_00259 TaxID=2903643 RepID=UPI003FA7BDC1
MVDGLSNVTVIEWSPINRVGRADSVVGGRQLSRGARLLGLIVDLVLVVLDLPRQACAPGLRHAHYVAERLAQPTGQEVKLSSRCPAVGQQIGGMAQQFIRHAELHGLNIVGEPGQIA